MRREAPFRHVSILSANKFGEEGREGEEKGKSLRRGWPRLLRRSAGRKGEGVDGVGLGEEEKRKQEDELLYKFGTSRIFSPLFRWRDQTTRSLSASASRNVIPAIFHCLLFG